MVWQIAAATGWSVRHILWGMNYQTLRMMLADAPHYETVKTKKGKAGGRRKAGRDGGPKSTAGYFQSLLNKNETDRD